MIRIIAGIILGILLISSGTILLYDNNFHKDTVCPCTVKNVKYNKDNAVYTITIEGQLTNDYNFGTRKFSFKSRYPYQIGDQIK